jgi:hypothetical protein
LLDTNPRHVLDYTLGPLLAVTWERFSIKRSHFWRWINLSPNTPIERTLEVAGLPSAGRRKSLWGELVQDNFAWNEVILLEPIIHGGAVYTGKWQIGFTAHEDRRFKVQMCTIVLQGRVAVLRGPYTTNFFASAMGGFDSLSLRIEGSATKYTLPPGVMLI